MALVTAARAQRNSVLAALDSDVLTDLINEASAIINSYCNRTFESTVYTEYLPGLGTDWLDLSNYPITAVTSVIVSYSDGDTDTITDIIFTKDGSGRIRIDLSADPAPELSVFPRAWNRNSSYVGVNDIYANCAVAYTAGYTTIPLGVQRACILMMVALNSMDSRDLTIKSEKIGDYSYTLGDVNSGIPDVVRSILAPYRIYAMA